MADPRIDEALIRENLVRHVDRLAGLIGPRWLGRPSTIKATIGYISREWEAMGYDVSIEEYDALGHIATNLIVERKAARRPDQIVVLGAHYDTTPMTPGADDNASAVGVLLEASRILRESTPRRSMRFIAFACEEQPYFHSQSMGSQHHARKARERNENILGMLCLEMVGYFTSEKNSQKVPPGIPKFLHRFFPNRGDFLAAVGNMASLSLLWNFRRGFKRRSGFPLFTIALPEWIREIRLSDNSSFWDQRYPALMLTDTSFLRNPHYHQLSDLPETLDYDSMLQVTLGVAGAMNRLSNH